MLPRLRLTESPLCCRVGKHHATIFTTRVTKPCQYAFGSNLVDAFNTFRHFPLILLPVGLNPKSQACNFNGCHSPFKNDQLVCALEVNLDSWVGFNVDADLRPRTEQQAGVLPNAPYRSRTRITSGSGGDPVVTRARHSSIHPQPGQ